MDMILLFEHSGRRFRQILLSTFCLFFAFNTASFSNTAEKDSVNTNTQKQDIREKRCSRSTWEQVVSAPGLVFYLPIRASLLGINHTTGWVLDTKIPQKINDFLNKDDGTRGVYPVYSARTGAGATLYQKRLFSNSMDEDWTITAAHWTYDRQMYKIKHTNIPIYNKITISYEGSYQFLANEPFFSLGIDPYQGQLQGAVDDEVRFAQEETNALLNINFNQMENIRFKTQISYNAVNVFGAKDEDEPTIFERSYTEQDLPGLFRNGRLLKTDLFVNLNTKNTPGNPSSGVKLNGNVGIVKDLNSGHGFNFWRAGLDLTTYIHLFSHRVLVLRTAGSAVRAIDESNDRVPFYELSELGEDGSIRGFSRGRFRSNDMILGSIEYRFPVMEFWEEAGADAFIFSDIGQVSEYRQTIFDSGRWDRFKPSVGFGIRYWTLKSLVVKLEFGISEDESRFSFILNQN